MNTKYIWLLLVIMGFTACNTDDTVIIIEDVPLTSGSADFSSFVALGASFTAGFSDGALFIASQENSFPNILSEQFANIGGGDLSQPLMNDNIGGLLFGGVQIQEPRLYFDGAGPVRLDAYPTPEVTNILAGLCLFLDEGVSLSVCVPLVCLSLCVSVCVSQYVSLSL